MAIVSLVLNNSEVVHRQILLVSPILLVVHVQVAPSKCPEFSLLMFDYYY